MLRILRCCLALSVLMASFAVAQTRAIPTRHEDFNADRRVTREVMHELLMIPYYSVFDDLAFRVDGGTVTLLGAVVDPTVKSDAEGRVKHIEGVDRVVDNIEVLPASP